MGSFNFMFDSYCDCWMDRWLEEREKERKQERERERERESVCVCVYERDEIECVFSLAHPLFFLLL